MSAQLNSNFSFQVVVSSIRTFPSLPHAASVRPSGENARRCIAHSYATLWIDLPVTASHNCNPCFLLDEARVCPSGESASELSVAPSGADYHRSRSFLICHIWISQEPTTQASLSLSGAMARLQSPE